MKYKLLKDTPFDKSGAELFFYESCEEYASHNSYLVDGKSYPKDVVENNPEWFAPIDPTCGKCGEGEKCDCQKRDGNWKMIALNLDGKCIKCGRQINQPKEEKIELSNIDFKSTKDWQAHFILLENKFNQLVTAFNNHIGGK